jgi:hypothetical protein
MEIEDIAVSHSNCFLYNLYVFVTKELLLDVDLLSPSFVEQVRIRGKCSFFSLSGQLQNERHDGEKGTKKELTK